MSSYCSTFAEPKTLISWDPTFVHHVSERVKKGRKNIRMKSQDYSIVLLQYMFTVGTGEAGGRLDNIYK